MSDFVQKLVDERAKLWHEQKALLDTVAERGDGMSAVENSEYEKRNDRITEIDGLADKLVAEQKRAQEADAKFAELRGSSTFGTKGATDSQAEQIRKFFKGEAGRSLEIRATTDTNVSNTDGTLGDLATNGPKGQYTVPTGFYNQLQEHLIEVSAILQAPVTKLNTAGEGELLVPKTDSFSTASLVGETDTIPKSNPTFGQASLNAYKYGVLNQISNELVQDSAFDLQSFIARQAGRAVGNLFGQHLVLGDGSGKPTGLMHASSGITAGVTGAAGTAEGNFFSPSADELIDLYHSVLSPYRSNAAWLMGDLAMAEVRKLKDQAGAYIYAPGLTAGAPGTILGAPVYIDPNMASPAAGAKSIVFGDLSMYWVRTVSAIRFERSDDFAFDSDVVTYRTLFRGDGKLVGDASAIKAWVGGTAFAG